MVLFEIPKVQDSDVMKGRKLYLIVLIGWIMC